MTDKKQHKAGKKQHKASCPCCMSTNVYGMSRVVGYYSIIENWNDSKQAELKDRQKGYYKLGEKPQLEAQVPMLETSSQIAKVCAQ